MRRHRLHVDTPLTGRREVEIEGERAHYLTRVLRAGEGTELVLFDGLGGEWPARVRRLRKNRVVVELGRHEPRDAESPLETRLVQGVSRGERMDFVIQKATELGVTEIWPVMTVRSVVRLDRGQRARRAERWRQVAASACEQCGRNRLPSIAEPRPLAEHLDAGAPPGSALLLTGEAERPVRAAVEGARAVTLLIGPEGGLAPEERQAALEAGYRAVSLGPRTLRTETAALAALAIVQSLAGDLG
jgi:16S rRNA (uracil1498-N3)-methyltransferase